MKPRYAASLMLLALMAGIVVGIQIEGTRWNKDRYSKTRFQI
jgi:hypothetical protein